MKLPQKSYVRKKEKPKKVMPKTETKNHEMVNRNEFVYHTIYKTLETNLKCPSLLYKSIINCFTMTHLRTKGLC